MSDNAFDQGILQFGDVLLYYSHDLADDIIAEKTGKKVCHVERFTGDGKSWASRNGIGVNEYPLRLDGLVCVRRPPAGALNEAAVRNYLTTVKGWPYDFLGLLTATSLVNHGEDGKMFCSEFSVNFDRAGGYEPFNADQPAFETYPRDLWLASAYQTVWKLNDYY
jgi:hypothetical protein